MSSASIGTRPIAVLGHWDRFYRDRRASVDPSPFAKFLATTQFPLYDSPLKILEFGCGNGRDAEFFASLGHQVVGVDVSDVGIDAARKFSADKTNPAYIRMNVHDFIRDGLEVDVVYLRWFLHSIDPALEAKVLAWAAFNLTDGGLLCIEARSTSDDRMGKGMSIGQNAFVDGHYRRFIRPKDLMYMLFEHWFHVQHWVEGDRLAPTFGSGLDGPDIDERPKLIRCIASLTKRTAGVVSKPDQGRKPIIRKGKR